MKIESKLLSQLPRGTVIKASLKNTHNPEYNIKGMYFIKEWDSGLWWSMEPMGNNEMNEILYDRKSELPNGWRIDVQDYASDRLDDCEVLSLPIGFDERSLLKPSDLPIHTVVEQRVNGFSNVRFQKVAFRGFPAWVSLGGSDEIWVLDHTMPLSPEDRMFMPYSSKTSDEFFTDFLVVSLPTR